MSQHQQAFLAEKTGEMSGVARQILSMLAAGNWEGVKQGAILTPQPTSPCLSDLAERLYTASFCPDPKIFAAALFEVQRGRHSNDTLAFDLIPAVARRLGDSWEDDLVSFADVTIGCARLQSALRRLPNDIHESATAYNGMQLNCLVMVPRGAQHTVGALVLARQLRQARQHVVVELEANEVVLSSFAKLQNFDVVLISASRGESPDDLCRLVGVVRQNWASSKVVVGGSFSDFGRDCINSIGADHVTKEWHEALDLFI